MQDFLVRLGAAFVCVFVLASCGGGGGGSSDDDDNPAPVEITPDQLIGAWELTTDPETIQASALQRQVYLEIHDGGFENEGPNGRLRVLLQEFFVDSESGVQEGFRIFFGELTLDGEQLSARLNQLAADTSVSSQILPADFVLLSGVVVDADTLSFVLETDNGAGSDEFGTRDFYLGKTGVRAPESAPDYLRYTGEWYADQLIGPFLGSAYTFSLVFPTDAGGGFGTLNGNCSVEVTLQNLGDELRFEWTRVLVTSCTGGQPFAGGTRLFGYTRVITPFGDDNPLFFMDLGNEQVTFNLAGRRPIN